MPSSYPFQSQTILPDPFRDQRTNNAINIVIKIKKKRAKLATNVVRQARNAFYFCGEKLDQLTFDHHLKKTLHHLTSFKTVDNKDITNLYLFKSARIVTTFVRSAGTRTRELWRFLEDTSRKDIRLAEMEHPSFKKISNQCTGRVPIYVHPCFYRALKLWYTVDVVGISKDGRITNELGSGSPHKAVGSGRQ